MNFLRTRIGNPLSRIVGKDESPPTSLDVVLYPEKGDRHRQSCFPRQASKINPFDDDDYLEALTSDSESTAASSKEVSLDEDDDSCVEDEVHQHCSSKHSFRTIIEIIFQRKANRTVLLSTSQLNEIHKAIATDYTRILLRHECSASTLLHDLDLHLLCASHILDQFWEVQDMISRTTMAATAQETLFQSVEDYLIPRLVDQIYPLGRLSPKSSANAITWIHKMEAELDKRAPDIPMRKEWSEERGKLVKYYLNSAVRAELKLLLDKLLDAHSDNDIRQDLGGHLVTGLPEQISFIINQQIQVASENLPQEYLEDVLFVCNQQLATMISDWALKVSTHWKDMSSAFSCAIVNDLERLTEYCRAQNKLRRRGNVESLSHLLKDISELSLLVTQLLCKRIIHNLREPEHIVDAIGSEVWESQDTEAPVDSVIATFKDFFSDFEQWLQPGPFFPRILRYCFDLSLMVYLESFFANTMVGGVNDPSNAAFQLEQDYLRLVIFFNGEHFSKYHGSEGFYSQKAVNDRVRLLQHMSALVEPTNLPCDLSFEVEEVLASCRDRDSGRRAVLHLAGLRERSRSTNFAEWNELVKFAEETLSEKDPDEKPSLLFMFPDVHASKMWLRMFSQSRFRLTSKSSKRIA